MTSFTVVALVAVARIAWGYRATTDPRRHQRLQPLRVSPPPEESNPSPPSMVEDDGYTRLRSGLFLNKVLNVFNPRSEPGALILVRHGQTVMNYNR